MMTDRSVLEKVINKALKNGMSPSVVDNGTFYQVYAMVKTRTGNTQMANGFSPEDCYGLIFSHDFAKAFWGEENYTGFYAVKVGGRNFTMKLPTEKWRTPPKEWEYHLQQMVLEENPIDYLRKFVETDGKE